MELRRHQRDLLPTHICKYCRHRFSNDVVRFLSHIRSHHLIITPYWYSNPRLPPKVKSVPPELKRWKMMQVYQKAIQKADSVRDAEIERDSPGYRSHGNKMLDRNHNECNTVTASGNGWPCSKYKNGNGTDLSNTMLVTEEALCHEDAAKNRKSDDEDTQVYDKTGVDIALHLSDKRSSQHKGTDLTDSQQIIVTKDTSLEHGSDTSVTIRDMQDQFVLETDVGIDDGLQDKGVHTYDASGVTICDDTDDKVLEEGIGNNDVNILSNLRKDHVLGMDYLITKHDKANNVASSKVKTKSVQMYANKTDNCVQSEYEVVALDSSSQRKTTKEFNNIFSTINSLKINSVHVHVVKSVDSAGTSNSPAKSSNQQKTSPIATQYAKSEKETKEVSHTSTKVSPTNSKDISHLNKSTLQQNGNDRRGVTKKNDTRRPTDTSKGLQVTTPTENQTVKRTTDTSKSLKETTLAEHQTKDRPTGTRKGLKVKPAEHQTKDRSTDTRKGLKVKPAEHQTKDRPTDTRKGLKETTPAENRTKSRPTDTSKGLKVTSPTENQTIKRTADTSKSLKETTPTKNQTKGRPTDTHKGFKETTPTKNQTTTSRPTRKQNTTPKKQTDIDLESASEEYLQSSTVNKTAHKAKGTSNPCKDIHQWRIPKKKVKIHESDDGNHSNKPKLVPGKECGDQNCRAGLSLSVPTNENVSKIAIMKSTPIVKLTKRAKLSNESAIAKNISPASGKPMQKLSDAAKNGKTFKLDKSKPKNQNQKRTSLERKAGVENNSDSPESDNQRTKLSKVNKNDETNFKLNKCKTVTGNTKVLGGVKRKVTGEKISHSAVSDNLHTKLTDEGSNKTTKTNKTFKVVRSEPKFRNKKLTGAFKRKATKEKICDSQNDKPRKKLTDLANQSKSSKTPSILVKNKDKLPNFVKNKDGNRSPALVKSKQVEKLKLTGPASNKNKNNNKSLELLRRQKENDRKRLSNINEADQKVSGNKLSKSAKSKIKHGHKSSGVKKCKKPKAVQSKDNRQKLQKIIESSEKLLSDPLENDGKDNQIREDEQRDHVGDIQISNLDEIQEQNITNMQLTVNIQDVDIEICVKVPAPVKRKDKSVKLTKRKEKDVSVEIDERTNDDEILLSDVDRSKQESKHSKTAKSWSVKRFQCQQCKKICRCMSDLKKHESKHFNLGILKCQYCGLVMENEYCLKGHEMIHTGETRFECRYCQKRFITSSHCKQHEITHVKRFQCRFCDKLFSTHYIWQRHEKLHTEGISEEEVTEKRGKSFKCRYCESCFTSKHGWRSHEQKHTHDKSFKCKYCEKAFQEDRHRITHELMHTGEKPHQCRFCDKRFSQPGHRTEHERLHTGEKRHKCSYKNCGKAFNDKGNLKKHLVTHTGERPFTCRMKFCDKTFTQSSHRNSHEKAHNPSYKCTFCDQVFKRPGIRRLHEMRHTGETQYECQYCQKRFIQYTHWKTHENTHTKPFKCGKCDMAFSTAKSAEKHEKTHETA